MGLKLLSSCFLLSCLISTGAQWMRPIKPKIKISSPKNIIYHTMAAISGVPGHIQPTHPNETAGSKIVFM